jgi:hypothetical protein
MTDVSDRFTRMAEAVRHNADAGFGGCFVICPPQDGGDALETLILDNRQDAAQFWILLQAKCQQQITALDESRRQHQAGYRR